MPDHDSPWKELVGQYFAEFLGFFFPDIAAEADPVEDADPLEQELRKSCRRPRPASASWTGSSN